MKVKDLIKKLQKCDPELDYVISHLKQTVKVLFANRHDVGYGHRDYGQIDKYRKCQKSRRCELRGLIKGIRILTGSK